MPQQLLKKSKPKAPAKKAPVKAGNVAIRLRSGEAALIKAAAGNSKLPTCEMLAYTGDLLDLADFDLPVVVDLATLKVKKQKLPLLCNHDFNCIVGHTTSIKVSPTDINLKGVISGAGAAAKEVRDSGRNGFPWEASIGAHNTWAGMEEIGAGETVQVNGRTFEGPLYVSRGALLFETSFVALGADEGGAQARVTGSALKAQGKDSDMEPFNEWVAAMGVDPETATEQLMATLQAQYDAEVEASLDDDQANTNANADGSGTGTEGGNGDGQKPVVTARNGRTRKPASKGKSAPARKPAKSKTVVVQATASRVGTLERANRAAAANEVRIERIRILAAKHPKIRAKAIRDNWSADQTELAILRAGRPSAPKSNSGSGTRMNRFTIMAAALCGTLKLKAREQHFHEKVLEASDREFRRGIGLQELLLEAAWANGFDGRKFKGNERVVMRAAFSSSELSGIFADVANKFILEAYNFVEQEWRKISVITPASDFKTIHRYRLADNLAFEQIGPNGNIAHGTLSDQEYTNRIDSYAKILQIDRRDIRNDDAGALQSVPKLLGRGAALKLNEVFWTVYNANSDFFKAGNGNFLAGTNTALSLDSITLAETTLSEKEDPKTKQTLGIEPSIMLVPKSLKTEADVLMTSAEIRDTTASKKYGTTNPHKGKFEVVSSAYLGKAKYGGSSTKWYLLADPKDIPTVEVAFLDGQETPTVEEVEPLPSQMGIILRGVHDFGVALQDPNGGLAMKGIA